MTPESRIYLAGHRGMVGSALYRYLNSQGYRNIITRNHADLNLTEQSAVRAFMQAKQPDCVILAAAKVGGIRANNTYPAEFIHDNLAIQSNIIHEAWRAGVQELLFLGSSCIYPRQAPQPMREECLLTGTLEPTNEPYAVAKIAGIKLCESYNRQYGTQYRSVMPTNLYGPHDNFHPEDSHVVPALIRRLHEAKEAGAETATVWGSGRPKREFLHVDDMAAACVHILQLPAAEYARHTRPMLSHINIGTGQDCTIRELAETIAGVVGYEGRLEFDTSRPDGTPRKLLDVSRLRDLGWQASIPLEQGLRDTYQWYLDNQSRARG